MTRIVLPLMVALAVLCSTAPAMAQPAPTSVEILTSKDATPRELYGVSHLRAALDHLQGQVVRGSKILVGTRSSEVFASAGALEDFHAGEKESFHLLRSGKNWLVVGSDASGVLYGALELSRQIEADQALPATIHVADKPAFKIRATCLLWMKYGNGFYDWPVTPANFPWFYNRKLMLEYLDELAENRYNAIVFWNGHPFPSFLPMTRYPEARMFSDEELKQNVDQLKWFTEEADRRGIWTVVHFYNIYVSPAFAKAHANEGVLGANTTPTPLLEAYTRYSVSEFVKSYPNVGVMITAGEALQVKQEEFVRDAVIAGLKDSGKNPPLIVRQWTIDPIRFRDIIKPAYDNLFTMMKHNTEMLVSPYPDPRNKTWISYGQGHVINVHENSDVKPFRWASPRFVQQMAQQWMSIGAAGFQLYPMVSWEWPTSLDKTSPSLSTVTRDRMWIKEFGRYGWNPARSAEDEERFWIGELSQQFGNDKAGRAIYDYYILTGPILPNFQNTVNIYNMNFFPTALAPEASLNAILHSDRWEGIGDNLARPLDDVTLAAYEARFGRLTATARKVPPLSVKEWVHSQLSAEKVDAINPLRLASLEVEQAAQALSSLKSARSLVTLRADEYSRFLSDAECILYLARFYRAKMEAATEKGLFDGTNDPQHHARMLELLAESVTHYSELTTKASNSYRQPTDLLPYAHWEAVRQEFAQELAFYREQAAISLHGADIAYLGLDGPMGDATNEFHWLLEQARKTAKLSSQSYDFQPDAFSHTRLIVVYDSHSPEYLKHQTDLERWVREGGKVIFWDPNANASDDPLLNGLHFTGHASFGPSRSFRFIAEADPLLQSLVDGTVELNEDLATSIQSASKDWRELAYTVLPSISEEQFYKPSPTFGPRWTTLMNPVRVPVLLTKAYGKGTVVIAQLGRWTIQPQPDIEQARARAVHSPIGRFVENVLSWAAINDQSVARTHTAKAKEESLTDDVLVHNKH